MATSVGAGELPAGIWRAKKLGSNVPSPNSPCRFAPQQNSLLLEIAHADSSLTAKLVVSFKPCPTPVQLGPLFRQTGPAAAVFGTAVQVPPPPIESQPRA